LPVARGALYLRFSCKKPLLVLFQETLLFKETFAVARNFAFASKAKGPKGTRAQGHKGTRGCFLFV